MPGSGDVGTPKALEDSARGGGFAQPRVTQKNASALKERKKSSTERPLLPNAKIPEFDYGVEYYPIEVSSLLRCLVTAATICRGLHREKRSKGAFMSSMARGFLALFQSGRVFLGLPGVAQSLHPGLSPLTPSAYRRLRNPASGCPLTAYCVLLTAYCPPPTLR
jgi:hypothetical protein